MNVFYYSKHDRRDTLHTLCKRFINTVQIRLSLAILVPDFWTHIRTGTALKLSNFICILSQFYLLVSQKLKSTAYV